MVRFSCFNAHIHCHRPKKTSEDSSQGQSRKDVSNSKSLNSGIVERLNACVNENSKHTGSSALERGWKSEEIKANVNFENDSDAYKVKQLKKSQSLGDELYLDGRDGIENGTDDRVDHMISPYSPEQNDGFGAPGSGKQLEGSPSSLYRRAPINSVSACHSSDQAFNGSVFSVGDPHHAVKEGHQCYVSSLSGDRVDDLDNHTPHMPPVIVKSKSMPNIADPLHVPETCPFKHLAHHSRSSDDLCVLDMRQRDKSVLEIDTEVRQEQEQDYGIHTWGNGNMETFVDDCYDAYGYSSSTKDWIVPAADGLKSRNFLQGELSNQQIELQSKDFKIKRIEEWVNDLQHISLSEEADELPESNDEMPKELILSNGTTHAKGDIKLTPGMEAAKKYVSSLSASATTAQLVNHGMVAIPFLSAFVGLRVLNLSGNAIVRMTAGALPRGLHALNLSKNSISNIEGLRELTRLRVLDMSYNRIIRIGHGLASCSALKELYLAGNKISEVEGLHRLLKLAVLDLRFNKISTAKCLGQLAANYNSLQAISLEGNPAQKNVGDEQLKKCLLGLLPHLAYFNRQAIRSSSLKDGAERSVRLGMSTQALKSDLKSGRKSGHGAAAYAHKPSSSAANHGRRTQLGASHKRSKDRIGRLPPAGQKGSAVHESQYVGIGNLRVSNIRSELSIRRSRSEGTLGAL